MIEDLSPHKLRYGGGNVINDPPRQEGVLLYLRDHNNKLVKVFLDKRDAAHIAKLIQAGRRYWQKFRLPKMVKQTKTSFLGE